MTAPKRASVPRHHRTGSAAVVQTINGRRSDFYSWPKSEPKAPIPSGFRERAERLEAERGGPVRMPRSSLRNGEPVDRAYMGRRVVTEGQLDLARALVAVGVNYLAAAHIVLGHAPGSRL